MTDEQRLRRYDKALRLRESVEDPYKLLLERKTFRGRIGSHIPGGDSWTPDMGRRKEEGHVFIGSFPRSVSILQVLDELRNADTWKRDRPLWRIVEEADDRRKAHRKAMRSEDIRYRTTELFDRYCWKMKSRVDVPLQIQ